jgi:flagellar basal-body rod protein FlgF
MPDILAIAEAGLRNGLRQLDTISSNVANINTQGYKRELYLNRGFQQYMPTQEVQQPAAATVAHDVAPGPLQYTGSMLHLALEGDGYFQLQSPHGTVLTRNGQFQLDARGQLVSAQGWPLQLTGAASFDGGDFKVQGDGTLLVGTEQRAQLDLATADPAALEAVGPGLFRTAAAVPVTPGSVNVRQGYLEGSNVAYLSEMIDLMTLTRQVQSAQQLMHAYDEVLNSAITTLGEF